MAPHSKVYLPRLEEVSPDIEPQQKSESVLGGTETVLLVEDEDVVRALVLRVLRLHGYTVLEAHDGDAALLISQQHQGPIQLLIIRCGDALNERAPAGRAASCLCAASAARAVYLRLHR